MGQFGETVFGAQVAVQADAVGNQIETLFLVRRNSNSLSFGPFDECRVVRHSTDMRQSPLRPTRHQRQKFGDRIKKQRSSLQYPQSGKRSASLEIVVLRANHGVILRRIMGFEILQQFFGHR